VGNAGGRGKDGRVEGWKDGRVEGWEGGKTVYQSIVPAVKMQRLKYAQSDFSNRYRNRAGAICLVMKKSGWSTFGLALLTATCIFSPPPDDQKRCGRSQILGQTRTKGKEKRRFVREKVIDILLSAARRARVAMVQTSRMVTIIEGVEVMETTAYDRDGNPVETFYRVKGERFETLKQAMKAARSDREGGPTG